MQAALATCKLPPENKSWLFPCPFPPATVSWSRRRTRSTIKPLASVVSVH
jgi:hypothetical protein